MAYFERLSENTFRATAHTGGAWNPDEQHIAPAMGLLAHLIELDRDARGSELVLSRLNYDILGTVPIAQVQAAVRMLRPGRTIELVEASMSYGGRDVLVLRAWLMHQGDTQSLQGVALEPIPAPAELEVAQPNTVWPGGFISSVEVRRRSLGTGRAFAWVRALPELVAGEPTSRTARWAALLDIANGIAVRTGPDTASFPNLDLSAHLFAEPQGQWLGLDTTVSFGADGRGLTSSVVHDEVLGPIGTLAQVLTVRPVTPGRS